MVTRVRITNKERIIQYLNKSELFNDYTNTLPESFDVNHLEIEFRYKEKEPKPHGFDNPEMRKRVEERMKNSRIVNDKGSIYESYDY